MIGWLFIIALAVFVVDIVIKQAIEERIQLSEERKIFGGAVLIRKVYNKGAMLNLLHKYPKIVKLFSAVCGFFLVLYDIIRCCRKGSWFAKVGMAFFTGGAWSNIYDRLVRGKVIDYFGFRTKWPKVTKITFNLGDLFIFLGASMVSLAEIFRWKR